MNVKLENIPEELKQRPQWVLWRYVGRGDEKPAKVPLTTEGRFAKVNDPTTWATYEDAVAAVEHIQCEGIGFVFTEDDPYCGVDIDNCRDPETGKLNDMLTTVSLYYEGEFDSSVEAFSSMLEPIMIVFLGIVIGFILVAMYQPIFLMGSAV